MVNLQFLQLRGGGNKFVGLSKIKFDNTEKKRPFS